MRRLKIGSILLLALLVTLGAAIASGGQSSRTASDAHAANSAADTATNTVVPTSTATSIPAATGSATSTATVGAATSTTTPGTVTGTATSVPTGSVTPVNTVVLTSTPVLSSGLTLVPASGPPGTQVTLRAPVGALPANSAFTVTFQDPTGFNPIVTLGTGSAAADGSINLTLTLPAHATTGGATIRVTAGTVTLSGTFVVQPAITPNPATVAPGSTLTLTGEGFAANNTITLTLGTTAITTTTPVMSDQFGHFTATLTIPAAQPLGAATVTARDAVNSATNALVIGVTTATASPTGTPSTTGTPGATGTITLLPTAPPIRTPTLVPSTIQTTAYFAEGYTGRAATNGKASFTEVLNILNPNTSVALVTITYYIQGIGTPQIQNRTIAPQSTLRESVNTDVGPDRLVAAVVTSSQRVQVTRTMLRTSAAGARLDGSTASPAMAASTTWGFPEGYTGITFQEYLTVLNPSATTARVLVRLAPQAASSAGARTLSLDIPAHSRSTANIRALNQGNTARSVGMLISSTVPIVAERVEYFGNGEGSGKFGATVTGGIATPGSQLRIAYGTSGGSTLDARHQIQPLGDQDFITLLNPALGGAPVQVTASFNDSAGHGIGHPVTVSVAPGTRQTIVANAALPSKGAGPFSVSLSATGPIEAESAQYYGGSPNGGTHPGVAFPAQTGAATDALLSSIAPQLPDGAPVARTMYLYNPGAAPVQVSVTYFGIAGVTSHATYTAPANGIATINVTSATIPALSTGAAGAEFKTSGGSFVVYAVGRSTDSQSAVEEVAAAAS